MEFYRYVIWNNIHTNVYVELVTYELIKETPKGYWIGKHGIKEKWIPIISIRRFAYPNKDEALYSLIKRTKKRIQILENQLLLSERGLELAKNFVIV